MRHLIEECRVCHKSQPNMKKCSACKYAIYCGVECQKKDWPDHKCKCKTVGEPIVSQFINKISKNPNSSICSWHLNTRAKIVGHTPILIGSIARLTELYNNYKSFHQLYDEILYIEDQYLANYDIPKEYAHVFTIIAIDDTKKILQKMQISTETSPTGNRWMQYFHILSQWKDGTLKIPYNKITNYIMDETNFLSHPTNIASLWWRDLVPLMWISNTAKDYSLLIQKIIGALESENSTNPLPLEQMNQDDCNITINHPYIHTVINEANRDIFYNEFLKQSFTKHDLKQRHILGAQMSSHR